MIEATNNTTISSGTFPLFFHFSSFYFKSFLVTFLATLIVMFHMFPKGSTNQGTNLACSSLSVSPADKTSIEAAQNFLRTEAARIR